MNGVDGERKNKRDVGKVVGGEAEEEVACSQNREDRGGKSCKVAGATFPEQSRLRGSAAGSLPVSVFLPASLFVFHVSSPPSLSAWLLPLLLLLLQLLLVLQCGCLCSESAAWRILLD